MSEFEEVRRRVANAAGRVMGFPASTDNLRIAPPNLTNPGATAVLTNSRPGLPPAPLPVSAINPNNLKVVPPPAPAPPWAYPRGEGGNLPSGAVFGGAGWPDGVAHKTVSGIDRKGHPFFAPEPPSTEIRDLLQCMTDKKAGPFIVSSTSEPVWNRPNSTDPHYDGHHAVDINALPPWRAALIQAAKDCGIASYRNEYKDPTDTTSGGNIHLQTVLPRKK